MSIFQQLFKQLNLAWQLAVLEHGSFWNVDISPGSVTTCVRCGGISNNRFTANLLEASEFLKIG